MAQRLKQGSAEVRVVFETPEGNFKKTNIHWMDRVANAIAQVDNAVFSVEFIEDGKIVRTAVYGEPSPELRRKIRGGPVGEVA